MNELFEIIGTITKILILFSLTYVLIFYVRKTKKYKALINSKDSQIIYCGGATHIRHNDKAGGYLLLSRSGIRFEPNLVSKDLNILEFPAKKILSVRYYWTLKFIPTGLAIGFAEGEEKFWVYRHKKWSRLIKESYKI